VLGPWPNGSAASLPAAAGVHPDGASDTPPERVVADLGVMPMPSTADVATATSNQQDHPVGPAMLSSAETPAEPIRLPAVAPARRRVQRTVNFDHDLLHRARAAASYLCAYRPDAGIRSLADIVNDSVAQAVAALEQRYNDGRPFDPVDRMQRGRPSRTDGP
jgi:hypothetical protein